MLEKQEDQEERRRVLDNDRRVREQGSTFALFAQSETNEAKGRFSAISNPTVIGAEATPTYPQGPAWSNDHVGQEPPLGYCVNDLNPSSDLEPRHEVLATPNPERSQVPPLAKRPGLGLSSRIYRRA